MEVLPAVVAPQLLFPDLKWEKLSHFDYIDDEETQKVIVDTFVIFCETFKCRIADHIYAKNDIIIVNSLLSIIITQFLPDLVGTAAYVAGKFFSYVSPGGAVQNVNVGDINFGRMVKNTGHGAEMNVDEKEEESKEKKGKCIICKESEDVKICADCYFKIMKSNSENEGRVKALEDRLDQLLKQGKYFVEEYPILQREAKKRKRY